MTSFNDYKHYYLNYVDRLLGIREQEFDCMTISPEERVLFFNYLLGTKTVLMIAFIESNFLTRSQMKSLRKFEEVDGIPSNIHQPLLSCFIYIRDCIAHNPKLILLPSGTNTSGFVRAINEGKFNYAKIDGASIIIDERAIQKLHLTIRGFFNI